MTQSTTRPPKAPVRRKPLLLLVGGIVVALLFLFLTPGSGEPTACSPTSRSLIIGVMLRPWDGQKDMAECDPNDPARHYNYILRWLGNLVYDTPVSYVWDETIGPTDPPKQAPQDISQIYESVLVDYDEALGNTSSNELLGARCSGYATVPPPRRDVLLSSGAPVQSARDLARGARSMRDFLNGVVVNGRGWNAAMDVSNDRLEFQFDNFTGCDATLLELMLSAPRMFAEDPVRADRFLGTGPFTYGAQVGNTLCMPVNPHHAAARAGKLAMDKLVVVYYSTNENILQQGAHVLISDHDLVGRGAPSDSLPAPWKVRLLPMGATYFALLNPTTMTDQERPAFWKRVLEPARDQLFDPKHPDLPPLESALRNNFWMPSGWRPLGNILSMPGIGDRLRAAAHDRAVVDPNPSAPLRQTFRVLLAGGVQNVDAKENREREPMVANLKARLAERGAQATFEVDNGSKPWSKFDVILFKREYDPVIGDPSQLLTAKELRDVEGLVTQRNPMLRTHLAGMSAFVLVNGPNNRPTAERVTEVQEALVHDAILFPLYTNPLYLYYRGDRLKTVTANFRQGLTGIPAWGFTPPPEQPRGGCNGTP